MRARRSAARQISAGLTVWSASVKGACREDTHRSDESFPQSASSPAGVSATRGKHIVKWRKRHHVSRVIGENLPILADAEIPYLSRYWAFA